MNILNSYKIVSATFLLLSGATAFAQGGSATDVPVSGGGNPGVNKDWQPSRTNDGAYDRVSHYVTPIQWQRIREEDILWKRRVWREIDTREKQNVAFRYAGDEASGGGMFIEILLDAIKKGKIPAYKNFDDRFTTLMTKDDIAEVTAGKVDTIPVMDPITGVETMKEIHKDFNPEAITKYRIKEDWIFDRNQGQMVVRIVGLAPVQDVIGDDGVYRGSKSMFWLYYPSIRELLAQYEVFNPQNDMMRYTWDEFFESRQFSSKITKVSNSFGSQFQDHLNPMESLYESRRTAEEIFNKEVDMWVY